VAGAQINDTVKSQNGKVETLKPEPTRRCCGSFRTESDRPRYVRVRVRNAREINTIRFFTAQLCKYAEEWANYLSVRGLLEHRPSSSYGENLFCSWTSLPNHGIDGGEPVDSWYEEIKFHPFGREPTTLKSGDPPSCRRRRRYCYCFVDRVLFSSLSFSARLNLM